AISSINSEGNKYRVLTRILHSKQPTKAMPQTFQTVAAMLCLPLRPLELSL
ncbi:hypothetical protein TorRG33x02_168070, partial [Trema orientale]